MMATLTAAVWALRSIESPASVETRTTAGILVPPLKHAA
jgi:hypothetical protein